MMKSDEHISDKSSQSAIRHSRDVRCLATASKQSASVTPLTSWEAAPPHQKRHPTRHMLHHQKCLALSCRTEDLVCKDCISAGYHMVQQTNMPDIWWGSGHWAKEQPSTLAGKHWGYAQVHNPRKAHDRCLPMTSESLWSTPDINNGFKALSCKYFSVQNTSREHDSTLHREASGSVPRHGVCCALGWTPKCSQWRS